MSNPLYYQWLDAIARRDQAMAFITVTALAAIGGWLLVRGGRLAPWFVRLAVGVYAVTLLVAVVIWR